MKKIKHQISPSEAAAAREFHARLNEKCREMSAEEAAKYLRRHVQRMRESGGSVLQTALCERIAELLEERSA